MSIRVILDGRIGGKSMTPTMIWQEKERDGVKKKVPFIFFSMWAEDTLKPPELNPRTGKEERPREHFQVILSEGKYGQNTFPWLRPGRNIRVRGNLTRQINKGKDSNGNKQEYTNYKVRNSQVEFLDSPRDREVERNTNLLHDINAISETEMIRIQHFEKLDRENPPRVIIDQTVDGAKLGSNQAEPNSDNSDPDKPEF